MNSEPNMNRTKTTTDKTKTENQTGDKPAMHATKAQVDLRLVAKHILPACAGH